jgi:hypothetical protein
MYKTKQSSIVDTKEDNVTHTFWRLMVLECDAILKKLML